MLNSLLHYMCTKQAFIFHIIPPNDNLSLSVYVCTFRVVEQVSVVIL